ncbi:hypothetical protein L1887_24024 [Cichorium endivia]|nr:hypothetical protein L1887_24024 [Cichorium endivia]
MIPFEGYSPKYDLIFGKIRRLPEALLIFGDKENEFVKLHLQITENVDPYPAEPLRKELPPKNGKKQAESPQPRKSKSKKQKTGTLTDYEMNDSEEEAQKKNEAHKEKDFEKNKKAQTENLPIPGSFQEMKYKNVVGDQKKMIVPPKVGIGEDDEDDEDENDDDDVDDDEKFEEEAGEIEGDENFGDGIPKNEQKFPTPPSPPEIPTEEKIPTPPPSPKSQKDLEMEIKAEAATAKEDRVNHGYPDISIFGR